MHHPEIDLTGPDTAHGVWALDDVVVMTDFELTIRGLLVLRRRVREAGRRAGASSAPATSASSRRSSRAATSRACASPRRWWATDGRSELPRPADRCADRGRDPRRARSSGHRRRRSRHRVPPVVPRPAARRRRRGRGRRVERRRARRARTAATLDADTKRALGAVPRLVVGTARPRTRSTGRPRCCPGCCTNGSTSSASTSRSCYPTYGLTVMGLDDPDLRVAARARVQHVLRAGVRGRSAIGSSRSRSCRRTHPTKRSPCSTTRSTTLGLRAVMCTGLVQRPLPGENVPRGARWVDALGLDSAHDYDPLWQRFVELDVTPTFHSTGMGWGSAHVAVELRRESSRFVRGGGRSVVPFAVPRRRDAPLPDAAVRVPRRRRRVGRDAVRRSRRPLRETSR